MTTDYRALCAELIDVIYEYCILHEGRDHLQPLVDRARALLDQPEPEGPTDEELVNFRNRATADRCASRSNNGANLLSGDDLVACQAAGLRAVLARWGNSQGILDSSPQPVAVSERLPGPDDCNGDGEVWAWRRFDSEGDMDNGDFWCLAFCEWLEDEDCNFTHWLPANALPTPEAVND